MRLPCLVRRHASGWVGVAAAVAGAVAFLATVVAAASAGSADEDEAVRRARARCEFNVIDGSSMTPSAFLAEVVNGDRPALVLRSGVESWPARTTWTPFSALANSPVAGATFRVGRGPYPNNTMTLREFVAEAQRGKQVNMFQFGRTPTDYAVHAHTRPCRGVYAIENLHDAHPMHPDGAAACWVLAQTRSPHWLRGDGDGADGAQVTYAGWLLGTRGTGIGFHAHRDAVNAMVSGEKVWAIESVASTSSGHHANPRPAHGPPRAVALAKLRAEAPSSALAARLLRQLADAPHEVVRRDVGAGEAERVEAPDAADVDVDVDTSRVGVCVQREGEVVFIPSMAPHAVVTVSGESSGIQFQFERNHWGDHGIRMFLESVLESVAASRATSGNASANA